MSTTLIVVASATPASLLGALVMWLPAKWARDAEREYKDAGDRAFARAEQLVAEERRTFRLPWFYEQPADPDVTGELVAVESGCCTAHGDEPCGSGSGIVPPYCCDDCPSRRPALAAEPHHDDEDAPADDSHIGYLIALAVAYLVLAPVAFVRGQAGALWRYVRSRLAKPEPYRGRHWVAGTEHTGQFPVVVPAQRTGDADE